MTIHAGLNHVTAVEVDVTIIADGIGQIECFECDGRGTWDYGPVEEPIVDCVKCKGTGRILVDC